MSSASPRAGRAPSAHSKPGAGTAILVLICLAILIGLGVWQLQRLKWKENLLGRIAALQASPARPLSDILAAGGDLDFVRVSVACPDLERRPTLRLFAVWNGMAGYRLIAACPISAAGFSSVLVDRGFQPLEQSTPYPPGRPLLPGPVVGVLRKGDKANFVTPANRIGENLWYSRDPAAMAKALGALAPAPAYLMLERPDPGSNGPTPAPIPANIPNRHFEYALTWFGLAASLIGVYAAMLFRRRRD
jgi:surfeit locus 1 family protein